jgi:hemolysin activation/secretion protein
MNQRFVCRFAGAVLAIASVCAAAADDAPNGVVRFDISRFEVTGNTLLPPKTVEAAVAPFTGKERDFGDVQRALEALESVYHALGYSVVTVELPEQELNRGVVLLKVVQTKVGRVNVSGNKFFDEANVRRALPQLREGQTPNIKQVSAGIKLANENPARKITMKLQSGEQDDEVNARLEVADESPWKVSANFDNTGTESTGKTHAGVVLQNANLFGRDHVASVQYTTTVEKPSQVAVYGAGYHIPLYSLGDSMDLIGSYSNVDSGTVTAGLVNLAVSGKGAVYGARYNHTLPKTDTYEPKLVVGLDYKAFKNYVLYSGQNFGNDVTVHPLSLNYLGTWALENGDANISLTAVHNVAGGNKGRQEDFDKVRLGANANFSLLRFAGAYSRSLPKDWQLRAIVNGQYASQALIPGEQFGAGGASSVRGFTERAVSNDSGVSANVELYTPSLCASHETWQCRLLAFYDGAYARRSEALPGELVNVTIGSVGLGLRFLVGAGINAQLDYGHIIHPGATGITDKNKLHVRVGAAY